MSNVYAEYCVSFALQITTATTADDIARFAEDVGTFLGDDTPIRLAFMDDGRPFGIEAYQTPDPTIEHAIPTGGTVLLSFGDDRRSS